jgi:hypothetical protein
MKKPDTMNHLRFFFFFFLLLAGFLLAAPAQGQTPTCLDFQDIPLGTVFSAANGNMPGDLILTEENVGVTIDEFQLANGNTVFGSVTAMMAPPNFTLGDGVALLSDGMNLVFDFSAQSGPLLGAGFGFLEGGGLKNISVNGGDVFVLESFADLPAIVAPGIESQVVYLPGVTPPVGTVLFSGPVHSLTVGGQEVILDNVCFLIEEPNPGCALSSLVFDLQDCDGTGHYNALVNFEYDSVSLAGFSLLVDGQPFGNFSYEDLPVSIGPFFGDGLTSHQIEIIDLANPDCSIAGTLEPADCSSDCLVFEGLDQGAVFGQAGGDSPGDLIFTEAGVKVSVQEFDTGGGSVLFGNALVENDPFQTNPPINGNYLFTSNINLAFDFSFLSQPVFAVRFGFVEQGGALNLQVNGGPLHIVNHFSELPQEVAPGVTATIHQGAGNDWGWVLLEGPVEMLMVGGQELSLDNFCYFQENLPCEISNVTAEVTPCENGQFFVILNFDYQNVGNQGFKVQGNGVVYGSFAYGELPVTIGPLNGNGVTVYEFVVKDIAHPDCHNFVVIDPVDCGGADPCEIYDLVVEPGECNGDGQYNLTIDFQVQNPGNDFFEVYYNNQVIGYYPLADLPVTIENFEDNGEAVVAIKVCINDSNPACCKVKEFESPCPGGGPCHIYDLVAETTPCENGQFYVILNFEYQNVGGEGFKVVGNGNNYGVFDYSSLPLTLGPFNGDGVTVYEFGVFDLLHPDCGDDTFIDPVECEGGNPCEIYDLVVEPGECNGEGQYNLTIDFQVQNPGNDFFEVYYNGQVIGFYPLADLPLTIENFEDNGEGLVDIKVCINDANPACCKIAVFESPCEEEGGDVWPGDANSDNIANNLDLLNLGIAFGAIGPTRDEPSIAWEAWPSMDWAETFPNGVNFKHADCDGTGSVDGGDIEAIELNYNKTHGDPQPVQYSEGDENDPPLFASLPEQGSVGAGDEVEVPIKLGTEQFPVENIYGLAFTLHFNPDLIDPMSVDLVYPVSWLGAPGVNLIRVDKKFVEEGVIDVALVRTDANPVSGFGTIMGFIGIIDDVLGKHELKIEITKVRAIAFDDTVLPLRFPEETIIISSAKEAAPLAEGLTAFPNPAREEINWRLSANQPADYAAIADLNGRVLREQFGAATTMSLQDLPAGVYLLKVQAGEVLYVTRFVRMGE